MEEYKKWLEKQIEVSLEDKDLQREHWAFCKAYEKLIQLVKMENLKQRLEDKKKQLQEVNKIRKNGAFKNTDIETTKIENQLIGEIQTLRQLV
jgi:hypothetical protein